MDFYYVEIIFTNGGGTMKNKMKMFLKQNGFLLILFIGVCVVAVGTLRIATMNLKVSEDLKDEDLVILEEIKDAPEDKTNENIEVSALDKPIINDENTQVETPEEVAVDIIAGQDTNLAEAMVEEKEIVAEIGEAASEEELEYIDDFEDEEVQIVTNKPIELLLPVEGEIIADLSIESLVYSKTLDEWRSHNGIDIKAKAGTKVVAPLDGTIKEVFTDDLWGITIIIDHGDGLESKICNLGTKEIVKAGISVKKGDYISTVGNTATIEMSMDEHIHFEASKDGKIIDPRSITN